jgi:hypothetical protein
MGLSGFFITFTARIFLKNSNLMKNKINRRDFLIYLGAGTSLAIAGFFTSDIHATSTKDASDKPKLADNVEKSYEDGHLVLQVNKSNCFVNKTGESIINLLDGKSALYDICRSVSKQYAIEHTDALETSVATFLCQLGTAGFLSSPFYVTMYENYC